MVSGRLFWSHHLGFRILSSTGGSGEQVPAVEACGECKVWCTNQMTGDSAFYRPGVVGRESKFP